MVTAVMVKVQKEKSPASSPVRKVAKFVTARDTVYDDGYTVRITHTTMVADDGSVREVVDRRCGYEKPGGVIYFHKSKVENGDKCIGTRSFECHLESMEKPPEEELVSSEDVKRSVEMKSLGKLTVAGEVDMGDEFHDADTNDEKKGAN